MLPRPCLSFTLPSIHDNIKLDCRVYHPPCLRDPSSHTGAPWSGHAAVVAHPYAPLGGCFDDPIVDVAAGTLLQLGFLVATFNFRGAASSEGHTSWTSKPEQADYISVVGFLAYYVYHLEKPASFSSSSRYPTDQQHQPPLPPPILLLAGYSYGAMVTARLPPLDTILASFATPAIHTAEADIRLRAQHLAEAWNAEQAAASAADPASPSPSSPRRSLGIRVGGDEDRLPRRSSSRRRRKRRRRSHYDEDGDDDDDDDGNPPRPRPQPHTEFQREERIRESVRALIARAKPVYKKAPRRTGEGEGEGGAQAELEMERCLEGVEGGIAFRGAYLVVSPPVGFVTRLATMSFANPFSSFWIRRSAVPESSSAQQQRQQQRDAVSDEQSPLATNPTLVVYGDQDGFISRRKIREWTAQLATLRDSRFRFVEVSGAGHFWIEGDVWFRLRDAIGVFATELLSL